MARLTLSRESSSSTNRSPFASRSSAPWPRSASESSGRGMAGWWRAVGWNCSNSTSATATPARSAIATPSPVASFGLVVTAKSWPYPPVASRTWAARTSTRRPVWSAATHASAAAPLHDQVERERALVDDTDRTRAPRRRGCARSRPPSPHRPRGRCGAASALPRGRASSWPSGSRSKAAPRAISSCDRALVPRRRARARRPRRRARRRPPTCRPGAGRWSPGRHRGPRPRRPGPSGWWPAGARPCVSTPTRMPCSSAARTAADSPATPEPRTSRSRSGTAKVYLVPATRRQLVLLGATVRPSDARLPP